MQKEYLLLIGCVLVIIGFAYRLNRYGYFKTAAGLLVLIAALTPWISVIFDPSIFQGDFVPLTYIAFSVLLSSILLPLLITSVLAALQTIGLILMLILSPASSAFNWFSFLFYIVLTSIFSILANSIIQHNIEQLNVQAARLAENEIRLKEESVRDFLTGLYNRRFIEETLELEILRAKREKTSLSIVMLDLDNFKSINDTLGHAAGDLVLQKVSGLITEQIRKSDFACRYGGDEFVLILPNSSREEINKRSRQLQNEVEKLTIEFNQQILEPIKFSFGLAVYPEDGSDWKTLLKTADDALYKAKG